MISYDPYTQPTSMEVPLALLSWKLHC